MICLSGKKRSGKDTAANFMKTHGYKTYALADPIKRALFTAFKKSCYEGVVTMNMLNGIDYDREQSMQLTIGEVRDVLIEAVFYTFKDAGYSYDFQCSTLDKIVLMLNDIENPSEFSIRKFMQVFGTDIICNMVSQNHWLMLADLKAPVDAIITDCRQPWEEKWYRDRNATFVFIEGAYSEYVESSDTHITELGLTPKDGDIVIKNVTLEQLKEDVECLLNKLKN